MLGAIIGDVIGSVYEWNNIKRKDFQPLIRDDCFFTDDTVMTVAVMEALMSGGRSEDYVKAMRKLGRLYPSAGYGGGFAAWLASDTMPPYGSWGNGSAMRVSPVGWWYGTLAETEQAAETSAAVTHDHPEGIKGAQATAGVIYLARCGASKDEIRAYAESRFGYDLSRTLDEIRPSYREAPNFDVSCQGTVPPAIRAFLESVNFEDAIRNAISLGGDSDTLAAITGGIAEAAYRGEMFYGGDAKPLMKVLSILDERLNEVIWRWMEMYKAKMDSFDEAANGGLMSLMHDGKWLSSGTVV
ncbi:MAG: ADP-ribosylglycohydrolase family protein [Synergistaceae bacterium]|jgi:ADP-ribosylglycohydrolase|nr:ADP-ribosylglycohydrolase family protein [Synergistaceae bacterium]